VLRQPAHGAIASPRGAWTGFRKFGIRSLFLSANCDAATVRRGEPAHPAGVIGQLTPPVAIALIITSRIAEVDQIKIFRANMPFFVAIILLTLVMIGVPEIATWLPEYARN
jgi:hypothetical protein